MNARTNSRGPAPAPARCAIYTRKSSDEGLDQDFNSLDAQQGTRPRAKKDEFPLPIELVPAPALTGRLAAIAGVEPTLTSRTGIPSARKRSANPAITARSSSATAAASSLLRVR